MLLSSYHIHYKDMTTSSESSASMVWDLPPHLPLFNIPKLEVPKELTPVANLIYEDEVPENLHPTLYQTENLPGLFALCHINHATVILCMCFMYNSIIRY